MDLRRASSACTPISHLCMERRMPGSSLRWMDRRLAPIRGVALPVHVCSAGELMSRVYARNTGNQERFALLDARQKNYSIREERPACPGACFT